MGIYVFSIRDARIDGKVNYVGLIPKLFDNLYGTNRKVSDIFDKDILNKKSKMEIFFDLLSDKNNLLWKDYDNHTGIFQDYLSLNDKIKIVYLNILQFKKENTNKREFLRLIKHLYEGHSTMQYGIYFGSRVADNDKDFLSMIKKEIKDYKNQKIIYYLEIDKLFDIIDSYQMNYHFNIPLLYFNTTWQYGERDDKSIVYNYNNRTRFKEYISNFDNENLKSSEIICHIPLSTEMFNHVFEQYGGKKKKTKKRRK